MNSWDEVPIIESDEGSFSCTSRRGSRRLLELPDRSGPGDGRGHWRNHCGPG